MSDVPSETRANTEISLPCTEWAPTPSTSRRSPEEQTDDLEGQCWAAPREPDPRQAPQLQVANEDSEAVEFHDIIPGGLGDQGHDFGATAFSLQPRAALEVVKECIRLMFLTAFLSLASFGFVAFYFLCVLPWPSTQSELPAGYDTWSSCHANSTGPAVTALGHVLPYNKARVLVSVPKLFDVAVVVTLLGGAVSRWQPLASGINGALVWAIALLATPVYVFADDLGFRALPMTLDPVLTMSMVVVLCLTQSLMTVRRRPSSTGIVSRYPQLFYIMALMIAFGTQAVLVNVLAILSRRNVSPGIVVFISVVFARSCSFLARWIFRSLTLPFGACLSLLFVYEVAMILSLRRYWLSLPGLRDVAQAAGVSAVLEIACTLATEFHAFRSYKRFARKGQMEMARVQIYISFTGIICDVIAEHVALHGGLGYNLFLDRRILSMETQPDRNQAIEAWALSFVVELVVDVLLVVPLLCFVPVSTNALFWKRLRSISVFSILLVSCAHAHLVGLHGYLEKARYLCD